MEGKENPVNTPHCYSLSAKVPSLLLFNFQSSFVAVS